MKKIVYADNAATTKLDPEAFEAMKPYLLDEYGNTSQPYSFSRETKKALDKSREIIAKVINASPHEIFFTSGGTESDNWAIKGSAFLDSKKKTTVTSAIEHHAILRACNAIERLGYPVKYLKPDQKGLISPDVLRSYLTDQTRLVSIMLSNNEIGTIEPIQDLVNVTHSFGSFFHTDAVQAVGHIPIDVKRLKVDMLSASAHKFNGPKGIGFLYIREGVKLAPLLDGGAQENGLRAGTENVASIVGMAKALEKNEFYQKENEKHILGLEQELLTLLSQSNIDFIRNGAASHIPGNISLSFKHFNGEMLFHRLDLMGVSVSTGSACDSKNTQISHVLEAIKLSSEYVQGTIRISLGRDNTRDEVEIIVNSIKKIIKNV